MALDTSRIFQLRRLSMIAWLALAAAATALVDLSEAFQSGQFDGHQPAIYTISDDSQQVASQQQQQAQRPYSWNNRRLVVKQNLDELERAPLAVEPMISAYAANENDNHDESNQFGDLSLLYSHASKGHSMSTSNARPANRWPATKSRPRRPSGTKGVQGGSVKGTKSVGKRPPVAALSPPVLGLGDQSDSLAPVNRTEARRAGKRKNLVCYYGTWAVYRPDAGKYPVENIDPFLCTHIIYGFTGLSFDNLIKPLDPWNDLEDNYGKGAMKRFTGLKRINPDLKALVAIGGWNEGSIKYSKMASEPEARQRFVASVVDFLAKYNFDGLDLDWEYPGSRGGSSYDKQNFVRLLKELHEAFKPHGYLLTAAVSAGKWFIDPAYDIPMVSKYLDLINLMAYDYHGGWETKTGMNAPLFHSNKHDLSREDLMLNVNWSVNYWLAQGASREKIMLGVGSYGRSFTLDKANVNGINAPASQKGQAGPYTREPGSLGYNEICEAFQRQPRAWTIVRDPDYLAPYAYNDRQWVGYDDQQSLALKAQYAKSMGLGGMMMWSIETDDFQGRCHNGEKYPLLNTMRRVLDGDEQPVRPPSPTTAASSTTQRPATKPRPTTTPATGASSTKRPLASTTRRPTTTTPGREVEDEPVGSSTVAPAMTTSRRPSRRPPTTTSRRPGGPSTSTARPPVQRPTTTTTTSRPATNNGDFECRGDGMFADPRNCRKFIRCVSAGGAQFTRYNFDCAPGTAFNEQAQYCDFIYNVPACSRQKEARDEQQQQSSSSSSRVAPPAPQLITGNSLLDSQLLPGPAGPLLLVGASYQDAHLRNQYYPGYFSHRFTVHHHW